MSTNQTFPLEILTPLKQLVKAQVTEVLLPAFDGQVGVLAHHEDFVGLLGTGVLKYVANGDDQWCLISSGAFEVSKGRLTVLAEVGMLSNEVDTAGVDSEIKTVEGKMGSMNTETLEYAALEASRDRLLAAREIHRRVHVAH